MKSRKLGRVRIVEGLRTGERVMPLEHMNETGGVSLILAERVSRLMNKGPERAAQSGESVHVGGFSWK